MSPPAQGEDLKTHLMLPGMTTTTPKYSMKLALCYSTHQFLSCVRCNLTHHVPNFRWCSRHMERELLKNLTRAKGDCRHCSTGVRWRKLSTGMGKRECLTGFQCYGPGSHCCSKSCRVQCNNAIAV